MGGELGEAAGQSEGEDLLAQWSRDLLTCRSKSRSLRDAAAQKKSHRSDAPARFCSILRHKLNITCYFNH